MFQSRFANVLETEQSHRYCKLHIQTWLYIHSAVSMVISSLGITLGILLMLFRRWQEDLNLYKQTLTFMRRSNPILYWRMYKITCFIWIFFHFVHLATTIATVIGIQLTKSYLILPQMVVLSIEVGLYLLLVFALLVLSATSANITWISLLIIMFFFLFAASNLVLMVLYHRFVDEKDAALRLLLANTKSVTFKESRR